MEQVCLSTLAHGMQQLNKQQPRADTSVTMIKWTKRSSERSSERRSSDPRTLEPYTLEREPYTLQQEPYTLQREPRSMERRTLKSVERVIEQSPQRGRAGDHAGDRAGGDDDDVGCCSCWSRRRRRRQSSIVSKTMLWFAAPVVATRPNAVWSVCWGALVRAGNVVLAVDLVRGRTSAISVNVWVDVDLTRGVLWTIIQSVLTQHDLPDVTQQRPATTFQPLQSHDGSGGGGGGGGIPLMLPDADLMLVSHVGELRAYSLTSGELLWRQSMVSRMTCAAIMDNAIWLSNAAEMSVAIVQADTGSLLHRWSGCGHISRNPFVSGMWTMTRLHYMEWYTFHNNMLALTNRFRIIPSNVVANPFWLEDDAILFHDGVGWVWRAVSTASLHIEVPYRPERRLTPTSPWIVAHNSLLYCRKPSERPLYPFTPITFPSPIVDAVQNDRSVAVYLKDHSIQVLHNTNVHVIINIPVPAVLRTHLARQWAFLVGIWSDCIIFWIESRILTLAISQ